MEDSEGQAMQSHLLMCPLPHFLRQLLMPVPHHVELWRQNPTQILESRCPSIYLQNKPAIQRTFENVCRSDIFLFFLSLLFLVPSSTLTETLAPCPRTPAHPTSFPLSTPSPPSSVFSDAAGTTGVGRKRPDPTEEPSDERWKNKMIRR